LAVGVGVLVALGAIVFLAVKGFGAGDADINLALATSTGGCAITTPSADKDSEVGKNHKVTWNVKNNCSSDQLVLVGNFRATQDDPQHVMDCKAGIIESTWPFKKVDQSVRAIYVPVGETQKLSLQEAKNDSGDKLTFYYDICMAGKKVDPKLIIDP
jgi:hypothetical protein